MKPLSERLTGEEQGVDSLSREDLESFLDSIDESKVRGLLVNFESVEGFSPLFMAFSPNHMHLSAYARDVSFLVLLLEKIFSYGEAIKITAEQMGVATIPTKSEALEGLLKFVDAVEEYYDEAFIHYLCALARKTVEQDSPLAPVFQELSKTDVFSTKRDDLLDIIADHKTEASHLAADVRDDVEQQIENQVVNPLGENKTEYGILEEVLQIPAFAEQVNQDLGFSLSEMDDSFSKRALTWFLCRQPRAVVQHFGEVVRAYPVEERSVIMDGFCACALDPSMGDQLLQLAQDNEGQEVLRIYSRLIDALKQKNEYEGNALRAVALAFLRRGQRALKDPAIAQAHPEMFDPKLVNEAAEMRAVADPETRLLQDVLEGRAELSSFNFEYVPSSEIEGEVEDFLFTQMQEVHQGLDGCIAYWRKEVEAMKQEDFFFTVLRDSGGKIVGVNAGEVEAKEGVVRVGKLYCLPEYRKDFHVGDLLYGLRESNLPEHAKKVSTSAFQNPVWVLHLRHGWRVTEVKNSESLGKDILLGIEKDNAEIEEVRIEKCETQEALLQALQSGLEKGECLVEVDAEGEIPATLSEVVPCEITWGRKA